MGDASNEKNNRRFGASFWMAVVAGGALGGVLQQGVVVVWNGFMSLVGRSVDEGRETTLKGMGSEMTIAGRPKEMVKSQVEQVANKTEVQKDAKV